MLKFTIGAGPNTQWRVRVVVHPSLKSLTKCRGGDCLAYFRSRNLRDAFRDSEAVYGEIHLARGRHMKASIIVHEAYHALIEFCRYAKLKINEADSDGEELAACSIEHMVENILWMLKKKRIRVL